ncbi:MAG: hypothetical protein ACR2RL_09085 [Gammaproteobacteria bacterium]
MTPAQQLNELLERIGESLDESSPIHLELAQFVAWWLVHEQGADPDLVTMAVKDTVSTAHRAVVSENQPKPARDGYSALEFSMQRPVLH